MTNDQILEAADECGIYIDSVMGVVQASPTALMDLYRRSYSAGMEAAAVIADDMLGCETDAVADAIRAANGEKGKA